MAGVGAFDALPGPAQADRNDRNRRGRSILRDEFIKDIARVELDLLALEATELRVVAQMSRGIDPGPAASLFKIRGTEIFQRITDLTHQAIGNYGLAIREHPVSANHFMPGPDYGHTASEKYLNSRKLSIYGGSNEIQRNIIAKAVLGL